MVIMKKLALLLTAAMLLSLLGCASLRPANPVSDFDYYVHEDKQCIYILTYIGESKDVVIPAYIENLPVRLIADSAFRGSSVENVVLPNTVEEIGPYAFRGCKQLKTIQFSTKLKLIDTEAFRGCTSLEKVALPNGLVTLDGSAFNSCTALREVSIPGTVKTFGEYIFSGCQSIENVTFEHGLEVIGSRGMFSSTKIKTLVIPSSVKEIKNDTFGYLKLDSITFLGDAPIIDEDEFVSCPSNFTIYYDPNTSGWDNTPLSQYNLVAK
jgi:hypothetical protein